MDVLLIVSLFNFDYGIGGILTMLVFYIFRQKPLVSIIVNGCILAIPFLYGGEVPLFGWMIDIQGFAVLALIPILKLCFIQNRMIITHRFNSQKTSA